jgi:hypothetical protein
MGDLCLLSGLPAAGDDGGAEAVGPDAGAVAFEELEVVGVGFAGDQVGLGGDLDVVLQEADEGVVGGETRADLDTGAGESVVGAVAAEQLQGVVGVAADDDFVGGFAGGVGGTIKVDQPVGGEAAGGEAAADADGE